MHYIILFFLLVSRAVYAQTPKVETLWCWNTYGYSLTRMAVDNEGHAVLSGCHMPEEGDWNILVRKLAADKDSVLWSGNYGIPGRDDRAQEICVDRHNNIYLLCSHDSSETYRNPPPERYSGASSKLALKKRTKSAFKRRVSWSLLKVSESGESVWEYSIKPRSISTPSGLTILPNGDILVIGNREEFTEENVERTPAALCIRPNGKLRWAKTYDKLPDGVAFSRVVGTHNGNMILASDFTTISHANTSLPVMPRVIELSRKGKLLHMRELSATMVSPETGEVPQLLVAADDTLIVLDERLRHLSKLSLDGAQWYENLPLDSNNSMAMALAITRDNFLALEAGYAGGNALTSFSRGYSTSIPTGILFAEPCATQGGYGFQPQIAVQGSRIYIMTQTGGQSGFYTHVYCLEIPVN